MSTQDITSKIKDIEKTIEKQVGSPVRVVNKTDKINATPNMVTKSCRCSPSSVVSPIELFNMADKLGISSEDFIIKYCSVTVSSSGIPVISLKSNGTCPFVNNDECSLGTAKPIPCALYPLSRVINFSTDSDKKEELFFIPKKTVSIGKSHTVEEWLKVNEIDIRDTEVSKFHQFIKDILLSFDFNKLERDPFVPDLVKVKMLATMTSILYAGYEPNGDKDTNKRFSDVKELLNEVTSIYKHLKK